MVGCLISYTRISGLTSILYFLSRKERIEVKAFVPLGLGTEVVLSGRFFLDPVVVVAFISTWKSFALLLLRCFWGVVGGGGCGDSVVISTTGYASETSSD